MAADQIANIIEGFIPLALGIYGLTVLNKKTILNRSLTKYLRPLSILSIGIGLFFIANTFLKENQDKVNYLDVANKINDSAAGTYVDELTRFDSVTLSTHNEFIYNYTIVNIKSTEVDYDSIETFKNGIRDSMQNNSKLEEFLKYGSPVVFKYFGADSNLITEIKFETTN